MHSLTANNSPPDHDLLRQDIPEDTSDFESMNYNVENPQTWARAGMSGEFMSLNMNYPSTAGSQHFSHGFPPRGPNDVPYYQPVYSPGMPGPAHSQRPVYPNPAYYSNWYPHYPYQPFPVNYPPQLVPPPPPPPQLPPQLPPQPPPPPPFHDRMPFPTLSVDHPVSSDYGPTPLENNTQPTVHHLKYPEEMNTRRAIEVHGCDFGSGHLDKYRYYFENERRGGGEVEDFEHDEENNMLVITFKDAAVTQRLLEKGKVTIAKEEAEIKPHTPLPVYVDKVLLKYPGAHHDEGSVDLPIYLEARAGADVKSVRKGARNNVLLVTFTSSVDIHKLQSACNLKPFQTKAVTVLSIPATKVLLVEHVPMSIAPETISDYFQTRKCGNDLQTEVIKVEGLGQDGCYLVHFADHKVVEQISSRVHTLGEESIKVHLHHKCIGWQSPEFTDAASSQMPGAVLVEGVHELLPRFLRKSPKILRNIQEKLGVNGLSLELSQSNKELIVRKVGSESKAAGEMDVQGSTKSVIDECVLHLSVPIPIELQENIHTMVNQIGVDETEAKVFTGKQILAIVGIPSKAQEIKRDIEKHIEDRTSSKGLNKNVSEDVKSLTPLKVKYLRECGFKEKMKQLSGVSVRFDENLINLSGPEDSVKETMIQLYELANGTQTSAIEDISPQQVAVLQKKAVEDKVRDELKKAGIEASWHAKESSLEVISTSVENVRKFSEIILQIVVERIVVLEETMQLLMQSESWESLQKSLMECLPNTFSIHNIQDKGYLLVAGLKGDVESVYAEVTEFLSSNTVGETRLKFPRGVHRFLLAHYKDAVATIAKDLKDFHVRILYPENGAEFTINGSKEGIDQCRKKLTSLADKVVTHNELLQKAGMAKMLKTEKGGRIVSHVEKIERCMIEVVNGEEEEEEEDKQTGQNAVASHEPVSTIVTVSNIAGGRKLYVREGDITSMKVSAIVNAANGRLNHCGGLAKSIIDKGGQEIQEECKKHVNEHGPLQDGDAMVSCPGRLQGSCDFIVHAVGPRWEGGKKKEKELLREAVTRSLELTESRRGISIAIPALSAGIFEYPIDAATKVITTAVRDYFQKCKSSTIKDVYFCTDKRTTVDSFVKSLQHVLGESNVIVQPRSQGDPDAQMQRSSRTLPRRVSAQTGMERGYEVKLVEGDIAQQKVDVIVTSRSKNMELQNEGPVTRRLSDVAGPELQASRMREKGNNPGPIVVTPGFNLNCKKVYHAFLKPFSPPAPTFLFRQSPQATAAKDVTNIVKECLTNADRNNCSSIAMPALGTGNVGYPPDLAAEAMLTAIHDFWAQNPGTSLTDIRVILYHKNRKIIQVFKDQAQKMDMDGQRTSHSRRRVILTRGSITRFKADVIVNPTDRKLDLSRGRLSKAISDAAGPTVEAECRRKKQTGFHGLAVTSAGLLQASEIYHVFIPPWDAVQGPQNLHNAVTLCLEEANRKKHTSLLFPTLGIGLFGYDKDVSARTMFIATDAFWKTHPDTTLTDVKIVIFDKDNDVAKAFEKERSSFYGMPTSIRKGRQLKTDNACTDTSTDEPYDVSGGITFGNIHFILKHGDLLQEKVDCIINSVDSQFNLKKGTINQALLRKFPGVGSDNRTQKEKDVRSKGLTVSQVAGATFNTVVHFEEFHFNHEVKTILKTCIKQAEKLRCSSVALPALGQGVKKHLTYLRDIRTLASPKLFQGPRGGVPEHLLMDYLYDVLQDMSSLKYVKEVRLVLYEADRHGRFKELLTSLLNRRGIAKKPFFGDKNKGHGGARPKTRPGNVQAEPRHVRPDGVEVEFFSDKRECIHSAKEKLENACSEEFDDQNVNHDTVKVLDEEKISRLQSIARQRGVSIDINTRIGRIRLQGLKDDVAATSKSAYEIFLEQKDDQHAEAVGACVQWYYMDILDDGDEELVEYDRNTNKVIEKRFRGSEESFELEDMEGVKYIIDFRDMVEYRDDDMSTKVSVVRKDLIQAAEFDPPHNWEPMGASENLKVCRIGNNSAEYRNVAGLFSSSKRTVIKIERVQNKSLYKQYMAKKEEFNKRLSATKQERQLWHGTAVEAIPSINSYGFNRSYCGKNAVAHGNGVYFAVDVNYSTQDQYSRPDPRGNKYIYLVDVLTGKYTLGKYGMRVPPPVDPATPAVLHDSVVENLQRPGMFVIFNDTQAYPKYLITCK